MAALILFTHIPDSIQGARLIKFINSDHVCIIQHIDLFQLARGSVFRCHHVQTDLCIIQYGRIPLSHAGALQNDPIISRLPADIQPIRHMFTERYVTIPGGQRPHVYPGVGNAVHPDPVSEQGSPRLLFGRVHGNDGYSLIRELLQEAANDLVCDRRFPRSACTCNA